MPAEDIRRRAEKRVREMKDFYSHLTAYVLVCTLLVIIDLAGGSAGNTLLGLNWAYWPIFGWGIAIVFHAVSVFFQPTGWEERKVEEYMDKERKREEDRRLSSL